MKEKIKKYLPSKRKLMQLYFALLFNANVKGFISGNIYQGQSKSVCVPGINCYSCPGAVGACPLGSMQGAFSAGHSTIYYVGGILLLYSISFGRMICGWLCPFGWIQELLYKIPTPKLKKSPVTRLLSYLKYVILVFFVGIVPVIYAFRNTPLPAFCKYICPAGTIEGGLALLSNSVNASYFSMLGPIFTWKFVLMVSIIVGTIFVFRLFCRFLCPLGALYGLFNRISFFGIKVDNSKCTHCNKCVANCKLDIKKVADQECISCGECVNVCPTNAISFKGTKILLHPNGCDKEKTKKTRTIVRIICAILMIAVLVGAWVYFWKDSTTESITPPSADVERGNQVGDLCYSYDVQIVTAEGTVDETFDPTETGKITVINFWGTWCGPCVAELPYFDAIASDYADDVQVYAIHSKLLTDPSPAEYIAKYYPNSKIVFGIDSKGEEGALNGEFYTQLGGRGTYPMTWILDEEGRIVRIFVGGATYEDLQSIIENELAN